jgi:flagellar assembly protein FliH
MSSSEARSPFKGFPNIPAPGGRGETPSLSRFIPREELKDVKLLNWGAIGSPLKVARPGAAAAPEPQAPSPQALLAEQAQVWEARVAEARAQAYQEGYQDGLKALESFKQTHRAEVSQQLGQLLAAFDDQLADQEAHMASQLSRAAVLLARSVLRAELLQHPEQVAHVAREAIGQLVTEARQVVIHVHPDELAFVRLGAADQIEARQARLREDPSLSRGGCRIESNTGSLDATLEARWSQAAQALGHTDVPPPDLKPMSGTSELQEAP